MACLRRSTALLQNAAMRRGLCTLIMYGAYVKCFCRETQQNTHWFVGRTDCFLCVSLVKGVSKLIALDAKRLTSSASCGAPGGAFLFKSRLVHTEFVTCHVNGRLKMRH